MASPLRIGIAGIRHSHIRTLVGLWRDLTDTELVAAADEFESARALARDEFRIPQVYSSWEELLDSQALDAVLATLPNSEHADLAEACAARGLPLLLEKPLAASLADADRIVRAAESAGTMVLVNWPTLGDAMYEQVSELIRQGVIGRPWQFTFRGGHAIATRRAEQPDWFQWLFDAAQGGGAWIDFAGYGLGPCLLWLGRPRRVLAYGARLSDPELPAEDTATGILEYEHAIGVIQTSHVQVGTAELSGQRMRLEVSGETGTLLLLGGPGGPELYLFDDGERRAGERIEVDEPAPERRNGVAYFAHLLRTGGRPEGRASLRFNREVVALTDAGVRAMNSGAAVAVPPPLDG